MSWSLKGSYVETCSCDLICPCNASLDYGATYDFCRVVFAFNIREGEIEGTDGENHALVFEARVGDNHHRLICRACGRMVDVDCAVGDTPCLTAADDSGYEVDEDEVTYWGLCPECVATVAVASDT